MIKILLVFLLFFTTISAYSADMVVPILDVIDGDTIKTIVDLPCPLCDVSIRIKGIDTPESNYLAKCSKERNLGLEAKYFLKKFLNNKKIITIRNYDWDKYGGRINADVYVNGINIADLMIKNGYARQYYGQGKKPNWCN